MIFSFVAIGVVLVAAGVSFFSPLWCWAPIVLVDAYLVYVYRGVRGRFPNAPDGVSPSARQLFARFGHFYTYPFAGMQFSSASSALALGGALPGIIGLVRGHWSAVAVTLANYLVMQWVSWHFNPTNVLSAEADRLAHTELLARLHNRQPAGAPVT